MPTYQPIPLDARLAHASSLSQGLRAAWLFGNASGTAPNLLGGRALTLPAAGGPVATAYGAGFGPFNNDNVRSANDVFTGSQWSMAAMLTANQTSTNTRVINLRASSAQFNIAFRFRTGANTSTPLWFWTNSGAGSGVTLTGSSGQMPTDGMPFLMTFTYDGAAGVGTGYINNLRIGTNTATTGGLEYGGYVGLHLGAPSGWSPTFNAIYEWDRVLTAAEVLELNADPFIMIRPRRRTYMFASTAVAVTSPGLEYTAQRDRFHYTATADLFHYTAPRDRFHFTTEEEDG